MMGQNKYKCWGNARESYGAKATKVMRQSRGQSWGKARGKLWGKANESWIKNTENYEAQPVESYGAKPGKVIGQSQGKLGSKAWGKL